MTSNSTLTNRLHFRLVVVPLISIFAVSCASSSTIRKGTLSKSDMSSLIINRKAAENAIRPGDEIELSVWGYDEFNTTKVVTTHGIITVPLIGEVEAGGLNKEQFKTSLQEKLARYIKGEINLTVSITNPQSSIVSVLGSVGRPDNYPVMASVSLFEILSKAGGATEQADLRNIKIYPQGRTYSPVEVDLTVYLNKGTTQSIALVYPGDIVYVPREENVVRELADFIRDVILLVGLFSIFN